MAKVCTILGPMRNGTTVLTFSLFRHPEVYGIMNLTEIIEKNSNYHRRQLIDLYVPIMKAISKNDSSYKQPDHLKERRIKMIVERNHIPCGDNFWSKLNGSKFKIISIFRDPREVILSALRWHKMPKRNVKNKNEKEWIDGFMKQWTDAVNAYHSLKNKNDVFLLRHEDMCDNTAEKAKELLDWLTISSEQICIDKFTENYKDITIRRNEQNDYKKYINKNIIDTAKKVGYEL